MSTPTSFNWTKNWEGKFSLLFSLLGVEMSNFKKLLGCGPSHALLFYKDGVTSCYFVDEEMATFGTDLVKILSEAPQKLDEWIDMCRSDIDGVRALMKTKVEGGSFDKIKTLLHRYGIFFFALKELSNYLPEDMKDVLLPKITEIRKYGETVYFDTSDFITKTLTVITTETGVKSPLLECLTPDECIQYFKERILPKLSVLESRNDGCGVFFSPHIIFLSKDEENKTKEYLFKPSNLTELRGQAAYPGKITAKCSIIAKFTSETDIDQGTVLVTGMTDPRFVPLMKKAAAIVTDAGGILCHAAIVSRELHIPCVVGTKFATQILKDGDVVEVDANKGTIKIIK